MSSLESLTVNLLKENKFLMTNYQAFVSVILPVYNAGSFLREAIESILNQTYSNFEFIIINDGSTDRSEEIIKSFNDPRIKYIYQQNKGLGATLNYGISLSQGDYIARQDQDDISLPQRFQKQVDFLESNSEILLVGTRAKIVKHGSDEIEFHNHATSSALLKFDLLFDNPFVHSSVMFRKTSINQIGPYTTDVSLYEDYDLWSRFSYVGKLANLKDVLVHYTHHEKGLSKNTANFKEYALFNQSVKNIQSLLGYTNEALIDLVALYHWKIEKFRGSSMQDLKQALSLITSKLELEFPACSDEISCRRKQYIKVMYYRMNMTKRKKYAKQPLRIFLLKVQNKLLRLHPFVIND